MKTKYILSVLVLSVGVAVSLSIVSGTVLAQTESAPAADIASNIQYPVAELGNCASESACKTYCDNSAHISTCLSFAQAHGLMSENDIQEAKKFMAAGGKGPGGCTSQSSCKSYCDDVSHIDECISFGEKSGMISGAELEEARKVQTAIRNGVKPPACGGKQACDLYCSDSAHMEECITFAQAAGLMNEQEAKDSEKMLAALKKGVKPLACRGKEECDKYCSDSAHMEECMTFAVAAGFMSEQEAKDSEKMLEAMKKGVKPPACRGKEECDKYCSEPSHSEECIAFAEAAGFMKPEEAAMARKTGGKGPGGCSSKEACEAFCNNPTNQETCFNFGRDNGMIPQEDLQKMEEGKKEFSNMLNQSSPEVLNCISSAVGSDNFERLKSGSAMPSRDIGEKMGQCFGQVRSSGESGQFQPGPGMTNPGGQMMPQQAGPGGCKNPEECQSYCESNPDACKNFGSPGGSGQERNERMQPTQGMGIPGRGEGEPGEDFKGMMQRVDVMQGNFPGVPEPGQLCKPGTSCGSGPSQPMMGPNQPGSFIPGTEGQFQQVPQQFQPGMTQPPAPSGGTAAPPPPSGETAPPPPPTSGSLLNAIKSFLGF